MKYIRPVSRGSTCPEYNTQIPHGNKPFTDWKLSHKTGYVNRLNFHPNGLFAQYLRLPAGRHVILNCQFSKSFMASVKIFAYLDPEQTISSLDWKLFHPQNRFVDGYQQGDKFFFRIKLRPVYNHISQGSQYLSHFR